MTIKERLLGPRHYDAMEPWPLKGEAQELLESMEQFAARQLLPLRRALVSGLRRMSPEESGLPWVPETDIDETAKEYLVSVALPGVEKKDVRVDVAEQTLTIRGERKEEKAAHGHQRQEQPRGAFRRRVRFPAEIKEKDIRASFADGILRIRVPKVKTSLVHNVKIE